MADVALGAAVHIRRLRVVYSQLWRTPEFKTQVRPHRYASLSLSVSF